MSAYFSEVSVCDGNGDTIARRTVDNFSFEDAAETARLYSNALRDLIAETGIDIDALKDVRSVPQETMPDEVLYGAIARAGLPRTFESRV